MLATRYEKFESLQLYKSKPHSNFDNIAFWIKVHVVLINITMESLREALVGNSVSFALHTLFCICQP